MTDAAIFDRAIAHVESNLVGQPELLAAIRSALIRTVSGFRALRPVSILTLGPTGVGKTLAARLTAAGLHGTPNLVRVDCGEYQHSHEIAKLIGAPPGYVGHDVTKPRISLSSIQTARGTCGIAVVLFDEIEKAHPALFHLLLSILDEGFVKNGVGETVMFNRTILFITSNCGSREARFTGFRPDRAGQFLGAMRRTFPPEMIGRIDHIVVARALTREDLAAIARLELDQMVREAEMAGVEVEVPAGYVEALIDRVNLNYAARDLRHQIERDFADPIAEAVLRRRRKAAMRSAA